jgi:hypothetical protein
LLYLSSTNDNLLLSRPWKFCSTSHLTFFVAKTCRPADHGS